jgi:hypothetical protein
VPSSRAEWAGTLELDLRRDDLTIAIDGEQRLAHAIAPAANVILERRAVGRDFEDVAGRRLGSDEPILGNTRRVEGDSVAARRLTSVVILLAFLALAAFSVMGNPILGAIFVVTAGAVLVHHAVALCPRCSNMACAFNPRASRLKSVEITDAVTENDPRLPITRTTVVPLLLTGPLAFIGAWQYSPAAAVTVGIVALGAHSVFQRLTCSHCGNDCAGNCNAQYREWRASQRALRG